MLVYLSEWGNVHYSESSCLQLPWQERNPCLMSLNPYLCFIQPAQSLTTRPSRLEGPPLPQPFCWYYWTSTFQLSNALWFLGALRSLIFCLTPFYIIFPHQFLIFMHQILYHCCENSRLLRLASSKWRCLQISSEIISMSRLEGRRRGDGCLFHWR